MANGATRFWALRLAMVAVLAVAVAGIIISELAPWWLIVFPVVFAALVGALFVQNPPSAARINGPAPNDDDEYEAAAQDLMELVEHPFLVVDARKRVELANSAALKLLGEHIVGQNVRLALRNPAAAALLTAGAPPGTRIELLDLGGPEQRWELLADPLGHKQVVRIVDRTPLRAAEKMRVDFVANASHELRTPLATLIGFIETLEGPAAEDADARHRFLGIMRGEAQRMIRLVDDLMSLSRIEADKHRQPVASVRMVPLVEEVKDALGHRLMKGDRRLLIEAEPDLPSVAGDRDQLLQLLHNLIGNAVKYGRPGTPIVVRMQRDGQSMIRIAVEDQGDGIAPEHLPRLTERFYRVDAGRSRSIGGTGLGLAIVKHIVERHRGQLLIASDPGVGTRVTALLPVASDQG